MAYENQKYIISKYYSIQYVLSKSENSTVLRRAAIAMLGMTADLTDTVIDTLHKKGK